MKVHQKHNLLTSLLLRVQPALTRMTRRRRRHTRWSASATASTGARWARWRSPTRTSTRRPFLPSCPAPSWCPTWTWTPPLPSSRRCAIAVTALACFVRGLHTPHRGKLGFPDHCSGTLAGRCLVSLFFDAPVGCVTLEQGCMAGYKRMPVMKTGSSSKRLPCVDVGQHVYLQH